MLGTFIETTEFTQWVTEVVPDDVYARLQQELLENPRKGTPIPGCSGLRKIRIAMPSRHKGKRSGARVIYLHVPEAHWFYMLDGYDKDEKTDLSPAERREIGRLVGQLKRDAIAAVGRS
jgi:hypothetical protein